MSSLTDRNEMSGESYRFTDVIRWENAFKPREGKEMMIQFKVNVI